MVPFHQSQAIGTKEALGAIIKYAGNDAYDLKSKTRLQNTDLNFPIVVFMNMDSANVEPHISYKLTIATDAPMSRRNVYIDVNTGKIVGDVSLIIHANGTAQTIYSGTQNICTEQVGSQFRLHDISCGRGNGIMTLDDHFIAHSVAYELTDNDNNWTAAESPLNNI